MKKTTLYLLLLCCGADYCFAEENKYGLTLDQAIIRVLENHPILQIADYESRALAARIRRAQLRPADRVNLQIEDFGGTGNAAGVRGMQATLSLTRTLERGNKAELRGNEVRALAGLRLNQKDIDRLDILAETARRFIHVAADQERLRMVKSSIDLLKLTESAVEEQILAGRASVAERQRIVIDLANYEVNLDHREHELKNSRVRLASLWNERQPDFRQVQGDIYEMETLPLFDELVAMLDQNPELIRYTREADLAAARLRLARSSSKADVDLTAGIRYLGENDDLAFMFLASIPLGTSSRAVHVIDEAESLSQTGPLGLQLKQAEMYATLFEIFQEMKHARDARESLVNEIIPATEKMLSSYEDGYRAGRYSLLELIQVQQMLLNSRSQVIERMANYHVLKIEIERLTGALSGVR